jgi:hypothetical protein
MHRGIPLLTLAIALRSAIPASAALIVNPPRPTTHQVTVHLLQTALNNGTSPATVFGDATRRAAIEAQVDAVWAQAGIDVRFLPNITRYNDSFAYQGNLLPTLDRPLADLNLMINNAQLRGGILHPDPSVINIFFVNIAPGYPLNPANWANGAGNVGANGIAMFIGAGTSADHAAHWVSHEIGHNLGLHHSAAGIENLMATARRNSILTNEQIATVLSGTSFPKPLPALIGDYNRNGRVDASDYVVWRKTLNSRTGLAADGNVNGIVDGGDYGIWRRNFGPDFAGAAAGTVLGLELVSGVVPEPASAGLAVVGILILAAGTRRPHPVTCGCLQHRGKPLLV